MRPLRRLSQPIQTIKEEIETEDSNGMSRLMGGSEVIQKKYETQAGYGYVNIPCSCYATHCKSIIYFAVVGLWTYLFVFCVTVEKIMHTLEPKDLLR